MINNLAHTNLEIRTLLHNQYPVQLLHFILLQTSYCYKQDVTLFACHVLSSSCTVKLSQYTLKLQRSISS